MSYPHRYIPPIYVDLNMPATPSKDKDVAPQQPCSPASYTTALQSGASAEPRPSRANSLFLDLLEFPLASGDPSPDALLKCELESVLDVSNGHDTPAGAQQQIFPLPNGRDDLLDQDVAKMKQSQDPEVLEEVAAFPAAVFTNTTISASRSTAAVPLSSVTPSLVAQRGGRTSQFSAKQRRERHNANERRRTNAAKDRVRDMRDMVAALERQRGELSAQRDANAAANEVLPHRRPVADVVPRERVNDELGYSIPGSSSYLDLVKSVDELRDEKRYLEEQLDQLDSQNSALQAVQAELVIDAAASLAAAGSKKSLKRKRAESDEALDASSDSKRAALEAMDTPAGGYCLETEAVPSYLKVLFPEPMTSDAAFNWVKDSYGDIMALKAQQKPGDSAAASVLGWREDKREVTKCDDESSIELMMTQDFPGIVSGEIVFNTWNLLTVLEAFQKLFPLAKDLAVLQTINDDCVVVRVGIAPSCDAPVVHSIVVLARGQIDGGYLVSMRSVPLSAGQKAFAAGEDNYLPVLAWFMLLDKYDEYAQPVCEVIVGASTQHKSERVLQRLATDFVAGVVRWQEAVGQSKHWLL
ncbi:UV excision repair protein [Phytophthora cinnamomi]|uniref:UV excision repair protein n=1 Tax=Phytophthora cinnamomi TaxID=4785 RepID=UPI0035598D2A|nr:UV excision repair protein [Phytophthora cinnamomi]